MRLVGWSHKCNLQWYVGRGVCVYCSLQWITVVEINVYRNFMKISWSSQKFIKNVRFTKKKFIWEVAKKPSDGECIQAHSCNSNLIVLDFWVKALFMAWFAHLKHCFSVLQTRQKTNLLATNPACNLKLGSIQQVQLLTVELCSKQAILANWM